MSSSAPVDPVPSVTVLVPARDEQADIQRCLEAIAAQDHPLDHLEVVVVDGGSTDGTRALAERALAAGGFAHTQLVENPTGTTPSNLNAGLAVVRTPFTCRVDARSVIPPDYVSRCVAVLVDHPEIAVTGGAQVARPRDRSVRARGIARALNNSWGMGFSRYRRNAPSGPADTVYLGAFRTDQLRQICGWDERFTTNQDFDLNQRMALLGSVWFESDLPVGYLPRSAWHEVFTQYHRFGQWKVRYWRWRGERPQPRQMVILTLPAMAAIGTLAWSRGRPARLLGLVLAGVGLVVAVEEAGRLDDAQTGSGPAVRVVSIATLLAVWVGWLSGVGREAFGRNR